MKCWKGKEFFYLLNFYLFIFFSFSLAEYRDLCMICPWYSKVLSRLVGKESPDTRKKLASHGCWISVWVKWQCHRNENYPDLSGERCNVWMTRSTAGLPLLNPYDYGWGVNHNWCKLTLIYRRKCTALAISRLRYIVPQTESGLLLCQKITVS